MPDRLHVTFVDNVDSFTYNLVDEFAKRGSAIAVYRNDVPADLFVMSATGAGPRLIVLSPGPGTPDGAGSCLDVIRLALGRVPIFGVCLGHQALVQALGGTVGRAPAPIHGKASPVRHRGGSPFEGLPSPMPVGRYHSLIATRMPGELETIAETDDIVMAARHRTLPALGVQFHPESVLTGFGGRIIENVIQWASDASQ